MIGEMTFDPVIPDKLWIADGVGVWNINEINNNSLEWVENSNKQEHLVSNDLVVNGTGNLVTAHWDRPVFYHESLTEYPTIHQPTNRFNSAWDLDVCVTDPLFIAGIIEDHRNCCYDEEHRNSGYSLDGGQTWTKFLSQPDNLNVESIYGNIAISADNVNNIVWLPTGDQEPYYTTDLGQTWQQASLPNNQGGCCLNFNFVYKKALTSDKVLSQTFYIYNWENGSIYVSDDGGQSWSERDALQDFYGWNAKLSATPDNAEHLWFSHGAEQAIDLMQPLKRSKDGGVTWESFSNTSEVLNHAIGAPLSDGNYPAIFIQGRVEGEFGYWMSGDEGSSWQSLGSYPQGIYDVAKVLEADPVIPTRLYVGFGGNGFFFGEFEQMSASVTESVQTEGNSMIYPNPTSNSISFRSNQQIRSIVIYNTMNQLVYEMERETGISEVDLGNLPKGIYYVQVNGENVRKLIKQ